MKRFKMINKKLVVFMLTAALFMTQFTFVNASGNNGQFNTIKLSQNAGL